MTAHVVARMPMRHGLRCESALGNALVYLARGRVKETRGAAMSREPRPHPAGMAGGRALVHELDGDRPVDDAGVDAALQELSHGAPAGVPVVERPVVHVHANEGVGLGSVESSGVLH